MKVELKEIVIDEKEILNNLMEKYIYEFSQYDLIPFDENGLYNDPHIGDYFTEDDRYPFFIYADGNLAGLALINKHPECNAPCDWSVAEFFVAYPYRRKGAGTAAMKILFERFKGAWQIKYHSKNTASEAFWKRITAHASGNDFKILTGNEDYCDGTPATVLVFDNGRKNNG